MFTCNHCPYVVGSEPRIENIAEKARESGLGFVGINSNDPVKYESDSWDNMVKRASRGMTYPYLHDEDQTVAVSYGAERTPEFYLVSSAGTVVYRGRMDDSPRDPSHASTSDLSDAMDELHNRCCSSRVEIVCRFHRLLRGRFHNRRLALVEVDLLRRVVRRQIRPVHVGDRHAVFQTHRFGTHWSGKHQLW